MEKAISKEVGLEISFEEGNVILSAVYDGKGADVELKFKLESDYFLDKVKKAIPGEIDDTIIDLLKVAAKVKS